MEYINYILCYNLGNSFNKIHPQLCLVCERERERERERVYTWSGLIAGMALQSAIVSRLVRQFRSRQCVGQPGVARIDSILHSPIPQQQLRPRYLGVRGDFPNHIQHDSLTWFQAIPMYYYYYQMLFKKCLKSC